MNMFFNLIWRIHIPLASQMTGCPPDNSGQALQMGNKYSIILDRIKFDDIILPVFVYLENTLEDFFLLGRS